jgi:hypothetical protein
LKASIFWKQYTRGYILMPLFLFQS